MNLQMELTNHCNLSCVECPHRLMERKRRFMTDEVFNVILTDYIIYLENREKELGYPPTIIFHKDGETLLHPHLKEYLSAISAFRPEFRYNIYTNGLLLTEEFIDFLATLPNLIWLLVSFHFHNADGKENDYSKVDQLMTRILSNGKSYKNICFVFTSHVTRFKTKDDLTLWGHIWKSKDPADRLCVGLNDNINPWTGLIDAENCVTFDACPYADFGHLFIGVTGNVIPCCMDLEEKIILGNVMTDSPSGIFSNLKAFYGNLLNKKSPHFLCTKCIGEKK